MVDNAIFLGRAKAKPAALCRWCSTPASQYWRRHSIEGSDSRRVFAVSSPPFFSLNTVPFIRSTPSRFQDPHCWFPVCMSRRIWPTEYEKRESQTPRKVIGLGIELVRNDGFRERVDIPTLFLLERLWGLIHSLGYATSN